MRVEDYTAARKNGCTSETNISAVLVGALCSYFALWKKKLRSIQSRYMSTVQEANTLICAARIFGTYNIDRMSPVSQLLVLRKLHSTCLDFMRPPTPIQVRRCPLFNLWRSLPLAPRLVFTPLFRCLHGMWDSGGVHQRRGRVIFNGSFRRNDHRGISSVFLNRVTGNGRRRNRR